MIAPAEQRNRRAPLSPSLHDRASKLHIQLPDGTHLDTSVVGAGDARRDCNRIVEVLRIHYVEPAELLLGLGEWTVGGRGLAVTDADRGRIGDFFQWFAALRFARLLEPLGELHISPKDGLPFC